MKKELKRATMDGNTAAAYASYAFTEVATHLSHHSLFHHGRAHR